ncbi:MAG: ferrous iron transport protein A [Clostridia bacterium]|nr:ferrous iron transport protein A [Clostridia bacterium]MBQ8268621.1 ferrous iron transport protein A [Clostridia bacterium]MBR2324605.1 ferrous iron transport protein A [Clostridia bacterium]
MNLWLAEEGTEYTVDRIECRDGEMESFLFSLGCFSGAPITVITRRKKTLVASIKDGRYSMDRRLAETIFLK